MKKLIVLSFIVLGCVRLQSIPLKGNYKPTHQKEINKPFEEVWSSVIDVLATQGLEVKTIDKASGIVISEKTSFKGMVTTENSDGTPKKIDAYIAVEPKTSPGGPLVMPDKIVGSWNIRVKESVPGKTMVNVTITGIEATTTIGGSMYSAPVVWDFDARSTGVFEKSFFAILEK
jgi:hypothetical protein